MLFDFFLLVKKYFNNHATLLKNSLLYLKANYLNITTTIATAEELVQQCIDGQSEAFKMLYNRYSKAMYNSALRIVNNVSDAEDVLQEAFTDAFVQLKTFEKKSTFGAWLKQIVIYKSINTLKKRKLVFDDLSNKEENISDENVLNEEEIWFAVDNVKQQLKKLPDGYRTVLSLNLLEGYDNEEIATILNVSHSTVRTQYIRGKQKLLQLLKLQAT
jgi:RNA polymerase sigma factor (sigma-70 family)